jgi:hypothetical protein
MIVQFQGFLGHFMRSHIDKGNASLYAGFIPDQADRRDLTARHDVGKKLLEVPLFCLVA